MYIGNLRSSLRVLCLPTCHQRDTSNNGRDPGYGRGRRVISLLNHLEEYAKRSDTASDDEEIGDDTTYDQTNHLSYATIDIRLNVTSQSSFLLSILVRHFSPFAAFSMCMVVAHSSKMFQAFRQCHSTSTSVLLKGASPPSSFPQSLECFLVHFLV